MEKDIFVLNIDTRFRDSVTWPNSADFIYKLNEPIKNIIDIKLTSIEFPNLYYTFSTKKANNYFKIIYNNLLYTISIRDGVYSSDTLIAEIQSKLDALNTSISTQFKIQTYNNSFKVAITNNTAFGLNFDNQVNGVQNNYLSLGYYLGYRYVTYTTPVQADLSYIRSYSGMTMATGYLSESIIDTQGDSYVFLRVNDYGNVIQDFGKIMLVGNEYVTEQNRSKYFAKLLLNGPKMAMIFETGANFISKIHRFRQPDNISKLHIQLYEPNGELIDMLQFDYSITLEVTYVIDSELKTKLESGMKTTEKFESIQNNTIKTKEEKKEIDEIKELFESFDEFSFKSNEDMIELEDKRKYKELKKQGSKAKASKKEFSKPIINKPIIDDNKVTKNKKDYGFSY